MTPVTLATPRLVLRPWRLSDAEAAFEYARDPEFSRYLLSVPVDLTLESELRFIEAQAATVWSTRPSWALTRDDRCIGGITLHIDHLRDVASLGYALAREHWGHGYATEATHAAAHWLFARYPIHRLVATADARNASALGVMARLGMQREALLRGVRQVPGGHADAVVYGITRSQWQAARQEPA